MKCPECGSKQVFNVASDTTLKDRHKECFDCGLYWQNDDTGHECNGQEQICHEFVERR